MDPTSLQAHGQQKLRQQQATAAPRRYDGQNGNPLYDHANGGHYGAFVSPVLHDRGATLPFDCSWDCARSSS